MHIYILYIILVHNIIIIANSRDIGSFYIDGLGPKNLLWCIGVCHPMVSLADGRG